MNTTKLISATASAILDELGASCPCSERHLRNTLIEHYTIEDQYFEQAIELLIESGTIVEEEELIYDLPT